MRFHYNKEYFESPTVREKTGRDTRLTRYCTRLLGMMEHDWNDCGCLNAFSNRASQTSVPIYFCHCESPEDNAKDGGSYQ